MKIGIELNEVLRDFIGQFEYVYNKYLIAELDTRENPVKSFDLISYFPFSGGTDEMNMFLYEEAALEVFGHADELHTNLINRLNIFLMDVKDDEEHEIWLISREAVNSIPATYFFLSKTGARFDRIKFVQKYAEEWDEIDVLITANPRVLECKPAGKIAIKVEASYNDEAPYDYQIKSLFEFMDNEDLRIKVLSKSNEND
jgi:hypothetical protein